MAANFLSVVPLAEGPLQLTIGVIAKADSMLKPAVRHFMAHLHRAAHHVGRGTAGGEA